jgi:hypothetical protein
LPRLRGTDINLAGSSLRTLPAESSSNPTPVRHAIGICPPALLAPAARALVQTLRPRDCATGFAGEGAKQAVLNPTSPRSRGFVSWTTRVVPSVRRWAAPTAPWTRAPLRIERLLGQMDRSHPRRHAGYISWETFELNRKLLGTKTHAHGAERPPVRPGQGPRCRKDWPSAGGAAAA